MAHRKPQARRDTETSPPTPKPTRQPNLFRSSAKRSARQIRALDYWEHCGTNGSTFDGLSEHLGVPPHSAPGIAGPLRDAGEIVATTRSRLTRFGAMAQVYVIARCVEREN